MTLPKREKAWPSVKGSAKMSIPPLHQVNDGVSAGPWVPPACDLIIPDSLSSEQPCEAVKVEQVLESRHSSA